MKNWKSCDEYKKLTPRSVLWYINQRVVQQEHKFCSWATVRGKSNAFSSFWEASGKVSCRKLCGDTNFLGSASINGLQEPWGSSCKAAFWHEVSWSHDSRCTHSHQYILRQNPTWNNSAVPSLTGKAGAVIALTLRQMALVLKMLSDCMEKPISFD